MPSLLLKKIALKTSEGEIFRVNEALLNVSTTIRLLIDEKGIENVIPVPDISSKTLSKIIEYLKMHAEFDAAAGMTSIMDKKSVEAWDTEFMKVEMDTLYKLVLAAHYLNIHNLFDLACDTMAEKIMGWTPEQIRKSFYLETVFTPREE